MRVFQIDYKRLVALLLPTMLRKPLVLVMLQCATRGILQKHSIFLTNRDANLYRLHHTGQVCYLRAALNDAFPARSTNFTIEDSGVASEFLYALDETVYPICRHLYVKEEAAAEMVRVWSEDHVLRETTTFEVGCPPEVYGNQDSMERVCCIVNRYKLLSKKPVYISL